MGRGLAVMVDDAEILTVLDAIAAALPGFTGLGTRGWRRRTAGERCQVVVDFVMDEQGAGRPAALRQLAAVLEELLGDPTAPGWEVAQLVVLEELANRSSHPDSPIPADVISAALGPRSGEAWEGLLRIWEAAADHRDRAGREPSLTQDQYLRTKNRPLRRHLASINRRLPDGRYVALADVLKHEQDTV